MGWIQLTSVQCLAFVKTIRNFQVPLKTWNFSVSWVTIIVS